MRLADAVDQFHLQRNDRHRRQRLGQQLERAIEDRRIEDRAVEFGFVDRHRPRHRTGGVAAFSAQRRDAASSSASRENTAAVGAANPNAARTSSRKRCSAWNCTPSASQTHTAISKASCLDSRLLSRLAADATVTRFVRTSWTSEGRFSAPSAANACAMRLISAPLSIVLVAIDKGGQQAQAQDGFNFLGGHMAAFLAHSGYDVHAIAFMREGSVCRSSVWPKPARRARVILVCEPRTCSPKLAASVGPSRFGDSGMHHWENT